jgi:hypothetical protein
MDYKPKLNIGLQWCPTRGWEYAMERFKALHVEGGVLFNGYVDTSYMWTALGRIETRYPMLPHHRPWVGFLHHPPFVPEWFFQGAYPSARHVVQSTTFQESLPFCLGLFTLSNYLKAWLEREISVPVNCLFHPAETTELRFTLGAYDANKEKKVVHVGWWLRKLHSFFGLKTRAVHKLLLLPLTRKDADNPLAQSMLGAERALAGGYTVDDLTTEYFKSTQEYDRLLSENIVFLDLYDTSANNVVVECIVRNTPLIINRHPAVMEYLGEAYPLYFESLEEASELIEDSRAIEAGYSYLSQLGVKRFLSAEEFTARLAKSEIYQRL